MRNVSRILAVVSMAGLFLAFGPSRAAAQAAPSLYDQLGKKKGITKVVGDFVGNVGADTRINAYFAHTDLTHLKMELVNQICQASGGPCKYTGKSMKEAHMGMGVTTADFNAIVEDLVKAMDKDKVSAGAKNSLLGALGPMKGDIVEKP